MIKSPRIIASSSLKWSSVARQAAVRNAGGGRRRRRSVPPDWLCELYRPAKTVTKGSLTRS